MRSHVQLSVKRLGLSLLVFISICFTSAPAFAATATSTQTNGAANGFQISPVRSELTISKGQSQQVTVTILNPTDSATVAGATVNDFVASSDESGNPRLILNDNLPDPARDFKSLVGKIPNVTLPPHASKDVTVTISVPSNANSGGYYGAIRFFPTITGKQSTVGLTASVGTLFLITVPGNLIEKLNLTQLSAAQNGSATNFITSGKVSVMNRLDNVGDIHVQPFGKVLVKNMFGKTVTSYEFNNSIPRANILPDSIRKFIDPVSIKSLFGHYTIQESLAYSNGSGNLINATAGFWYLPVWFLLAVAVVVVLLVSFIYWLTTRRRHRHKRR
jgi:hypothetical protein